MIVFSLARTIADWESAIIWPILIVVLIFFIFRTGRR